MKIENANIIDPQFFIENHFYYDKITSGRWTNWNRTFLTKETEYGKTCYKIITLNIFERLYIDALRFLKLYNKEWILSPYALNNFHQALAINSLSSLIEKTSVPSPLKTPHTKVVSLSVDKEIKVGFITNQSSTQIIKQKKAEILEDSTLLTTINHSTTLDASAADQKVLNTSEEECELSLLISSPTKELEIESNVSKITHEAPPKINKEKMREFTARWMLEQNKPLQGTYLPINHSSSSNIYVGEYGNTIQTSGAIYINGVCVKESSHPSHTATSHISIQTNRSNTQREKMIF